MPSGTEKLPDHAKLTIWQREDGYYWLIDQEEGERSGDMGPFETQMEAEEDAHTWWANRHVDEDPFLLS